MRWEVVVVVVVPLMAGKRFNTPEDQKPDALSHSAAVSRLTRVG
jgi:hypothetical protein